MTKHNLKIAVLCILAVVQQGCSSILGTSDEITNSIDKAASPVNGFSLVSETTGDQALVFLEGSAGAVAVYETAYKNGLEQRIVLPAYSIVKGENVIQARLVTSKKVTDEYEQLRPFSLDATRLSAEFKKHFPKRKFRFANQLQTNRYGDFGYYYFKVSQGVSCLFAWQQLHQQKQKRGNLVERVKGLWDPLARATLSYRVRYCAPGFSSAEAIALMKSVRIDVDEGKLRRRKQSQWLSARNSEDVIDMGNLNERGYLSQKTSNTSSHYISNQHCDMVHFDVQAGCAAKHSSTAGNRPKAVKKGVRNTTPTTIKPKTETVVVPAPDLKPASSKPSRQANIARVASKNHDSGRLLVPTP